MPTNRITFNASHLDQPIISANSNLLSVFEPHAEAVLNALNQESDYTQQVVRAIVQQVKGEVTSKYKQSPVA